MNNDLTVAELVVAARGADDDAWTALNDRFRDLAVAVSLGILTDPEAAQDAAQEAFLLAATHIGGLRDPAAFPGWFSRLVRTACSRRIRARRTVEPLDERAVSDAADPAEVVADRAERSRLRAAVEALPRHEAAVIALHYLGGLSYPEVAEFLDVRESTVRKRAHSARARLLRSFPMTADALVEPRPSRGGQSRNSVLLFQAIRHRDLSTIEGLLAADPNLVGVTEDWSGEEGALAELPLARRASALVRAVQTGDLGAVRLIVEAGAHIEERCQCQGAESPLWAACVGGEDDIVEYLLCRGADPNAVAFAGATPLHVAAQRGHHRIARRLLAAGADPERRDAQGRTPSDWAVLGRSSLEASEDEYLPTGIRAIDLFAPLRRGGLTHWPPAVSLGQMVAIIELADCLAPAQCWWTGFAHGPANRPTVEHGLHEADLGAALRIVPTGRDTSSRRHAFQAAIDELASDPNDKFVVIQAAPGHGHDITLALPRLRADPNVVLTAVIEAFNPSFRLLPVPPEGFHAQISFDARRARANLWPAIDHTHTIAKAFPNHRHEELAAEVRYLLDRYLRLDPKLQLPPSSATADPNLAQGAQRIIAYLVQPFRCAEPFTSLPVDRTSYADLLDHVETLVRGVEPAD